MARARARAGGELRWVGSLGVEVAGPRLSRGPAEVFCCIRLRRGLLIRLADSQLKFLNAGKTPGEL